MCLTLLYTSATYLEQITQVVQVHLKICYESWTTGKSIIYPQHLTVKIYSHVQHLPLEKLVKHFRIKFSRPHFSSARHCSNDIPLPSRLNFYDLSSKELKYRNKQTVSPVVAPFSHTHYDLDWNRRNIDMTLKEHKPAHLLFFASSSVQIVLI